MNSRVSNIRHRWDIGISMGDWRFVTPEFYIETGAATLQAHGAISAPG
jgi:hypothetical protein